jgi:hypothetical protein
VIIRRLSAAVLGAGDGCPPLSTLTLDQRTCSHDHGFIVSTPRM